MRALTHLLAVVAVSALVLGCGDKPAGGDGPAGDKAAKKAPTTENKAGKPETYPAFSLAWSEYPSWSAFGVASEVGIINGKKGKLGEIEKKWKVDIVLKEADYDTCLTMYGAGKADAAALTNMDSLNPALTRPTVAILPTSRSHGADALIVTNDIKDVTQLKGKKVYGLSATVSEYMFARNLELQGQKEADYVFTNKDPGAAALAMQQKQAGYNAIAVWNPFVLETLRKRSDTHVLFDSTKIPGEILDLVVMSKDALKKPGGDRFAKAVADAFYAINKRIADPKTADDTLVALGEKFSNLDLASMKTVVQQTVFYPNADAGIALFKGAELKSVMDRVVKFCVDHEIVKGAPTLAYGAGDAQFTFDTRYMEAVKAKNGGK
jgi:NitT/TauT family transport system substrate-binding protein